MSDVLLRYDRFYTGETFDEPLWLIVTEGSPEHGGKGKVLCGGDPLGYPRGHEFHFGADENFPNRERETVMLEDAPIEVVAEWVRLVHLGKLQAEGDVHV